jgi:predicted MFS family arabinose efflux permease
MNTIKNKLFWVYALSASVYFGQGIEGLPNLPFFFYLKEKLGLDESRIMFLCSWITLAWLVKPILGYLIDSSRFSKKVWIIGSLLGSLTFATLLGMINYLPLVWLLIFMAIASSTTAVRDVCTDGVMCVEGKKAKITGRIQSIQWGFITVASVLTGFLGGYISEHWNYQVGYLILIPIYLVIIAIVMNYKDDNSVTKSSINLLQTLIELFTDKRLLLVCLFLFLYKFSPAFGTPLSFIMRDTFHWSKQWLGTLDTISAAVGLLGAWVYFHYSKRLNLTKWLIASVFIGSITTLCYLYFTPQTAIAYTIIFSVMGMFISLLLLDFMARNTKSGLESTSFALLCSVSNLASTCNGFTGSYLFPILGLQWLIIISAITSFACLPIIPFLKGEPHVND